MRTQTKMNKGPGMAARPGRHGVGKLIFLMLVLLTTAVSAQDVPSLFLTWDESVGCVVGSNYPDRKSYQELIDDGECLQVCQRSIVTYHLFNPDSNWNHTDRRAYPSRKHTDHLYRKMGPADWRSRKYRRDGLS